MKNVASAHEQKPLKLPSEVVQRHILAKGFQVSLLAPCKHLYKWMSAETIDLIQQIMAPEQFSTVNSQT